MSFLISLAPLIGLAYSASRTTAPFGALVVGGDSDYSTIQDAVDAFSSSSSDEQSIFISAGTYKEQIYVKELSGPVTIYGYRETGWSIWNDDDLRTDGVEFGEFENTGPGSEGTRADFATMLSAAVAIENVLGSDYADASWVDVTYL